MVFPLDPTMIKRQLVADPQGSRPTVVVIIQYNKRRTIMISYHGDKPHGDRFE